MARMWRSEIPGSWPSAHASNGLQVLKVLAGADRIAVTWLCPLDVLAIRSVDLLVDARMQKHHVTPDLRRQAHNLEVGGSSPLSATSPVGATMCAQ